MRIDHPATSDWLDVTAQRCAKALSLPPEQQAELRDLLSAALTAFPDEALEADLMESLHGFIARNRRQSMSEAAWDLWQKAVQLYRRTGPQALEAPGAARDAWQRTGRAWFEHASGTTLHQPVKLIRKHGLPRDMVVSGVEILCDKGELEGYAVFEARVYRPPRTSSCQIFTPGDALVRLEWDDLPPRARLEAQPTM